MRKETIETININDLYTYNLSRIKYLKIYNSLIIDLPKKLINLETLILNNCHYIKIIPSYKKLKILEIYDCNNLIKLPNDLINLQNLTINNCPNLNYLQL